MCLLSDVNKGGVVAGGPEVMNNSHYLPIWWMMAALKVNLNDGRVRSNRGHTLSDSNKYENTQLLLLS